MGVLTLKKRFQHHHRLHGLWKISLVVMISSLAFSIVDTIWAVYMGEILGSVVIVGLFSAAFTVLSFFSYFIFIPTMERMNKAQIYSISLAVIAISYILFSLTRNLGIFILAGVIATLVNSLRLTSLGIILRDNSDRKKVANNFGMMYSIAAAFWIVGPLISSYISARYGMNVIFSIGALLILISLLVFRISKVSDNNVKKRIDKNFIKNFKAFFKSKDRIKCYILNGGCGLWLVLAYLFMPLYIIKNDFSIAWVGYFLFALAIIPTIGEYLFGKLASRIGYKKIFQIGFYLMAITGVIAFFTPNPLVVMGLMLISSIGIAMTESTTDSYFLDMTTDKEELRFYGPYNTAIDAGNFVSKIIPAILLIFLPFNYVFLFFALLMAYVGWVSSTIKDRIESRRKS